jgi:hypothetical protein
MKIYEIITHDDDPIYVSTKKEVKQEIKNLPVGVLCYVNEIEFEYNLKSICWLCSHVWK